MIVSGWGRYPKVDCIVSSPQTTGEIIGFLPNGSAIARGGGRAYGDSAISDKNTIQMRSFDQFVEFDRVSGVLTASAGVQMRDIIETFLPSGWFLPVTPGTSYVTVGGAIAADVHGKNHHHAGTFCQHVHEIELMLGSGEVVKISPILYPDLFHATCGGMGLTGIILSAQIQLIRVSSGYINQNTLSAQNIDELFNLFDAHSHVNYSVAWIDCLANKGALGRSVLMLGEHSDNGRLECHLAQRLSIPFNAPSFLLNHCSIKTFNRLYYAKSKNQQDSCVTIYEYFYPLDKIGCWNRLYGSNGFIQYQFVIPKERGLENMRRIIGKIIDSGEGSFLAVIKLFGEANANLLSFPFKGYTLALDFHINHNTRALIKTLDDMVTEIGGRIYLAKDSLMSANMFKSTYSRWEEFEAVRQKYGAIGKFSSVQSARLGLK